MALFHRTPAIAPGEAARRLAAGKLTLVDVREPHELLDGRVRGSLNLPLNQLAGRLGELDRDRPVAFMCRPGARSATATRTAAGAGFDAVNVKGGMLAWTRAGLPVA